METAIQVFAGIVGVIRPFLIGRELNEHLQKSYEAVAHILVGGLFAAWWVGDIEWCLIVAVGLTIIEVMSAIVSVVVKRMVTYTL